MAGGGRRCSFLVNSRITVGAWFVSGGFYVPDPGYEGSSLRSAAGRLVGHAPAEHAASTEIVGARGGGALRSAVRSRGAPTRALLVPVALFAAARAAASTRSTRATRSASATWFRCVAACALFSGLAVGVLRRYPALVLAGVLVGHHAARVAAVAARRADAARGAVGSAGQRGTPRA